MAGGDQQEKDLYDNFSSPTGSTTSVITVASIAAFEWRSVTVMDLGGAFLNAEITSTGIKLHMRLSRVLTDMLVLIDPTHACFVEERGTSVVELDKTLCGCVEAAALWYSDLCATMRGAGFAPSPYDPCVYNKNASSGTQVTAVIHVDDLFISGLDEIDREEFGNNTRNKYREVKVNKGKIVN